MNGKIKETCEWLTDLLKMYYEKMDASGYFIITACRVSFMNFTYLWILSIYSFLVSRIFDLSICNHYSQCNKPQCLTFCLCVAAHENSRQNKPSRTVWVASACAAAKTGVAASQRRELMVQEQGKKETQEVGEGVEETSYHSSECYIEDERHHCHNHHHHPSHAATSK